MTRRTDGKLARTTKFFKNLQRYRQIRGIPRPKGWLPLERRDTTRRRRGR